MEACCKTRKTARSAEKKQKLTARVNRIIGQMNGIKKMIEEDRYCDDVLIQLSAVDKSVKSLADAVFDDHLRVCLAEEIRAGNDAVFDEVLDLFRRFQ